MSKDDEKMERKDGADGEDIQWFENYEKYGKSGEHSDSLKKEDILNYIKDIERNCRLEMNSGDEDYADTKKSSNCKARCPRARFRSSKVPRSRATSRRNKSANSLRRKVKPNPLNATDARSYSRSSQTPRFSGNANLAVNSADFRENLNAAGSAYSNKRRLYNHQKSSPRFYCWYSRKDRKTWPVTTEMTSFEIVTDRSGTADRQISSSSISEKGSLGLLREFEFPRKEMDELDASIHSNVASNEQARVKNLPRKDHRKITCSLGCNDQGDAGGLANQRRVDEFYIDRDAYSADLLHRNSRNESCEGPCASRYHYSESAQPSWSQNCPCNKQTTPRLAEMRSRRRALRRKDEEEALVEADSITGWIDGVYQESWHRNNTDQWRREPCCREPDFLKESGRLRKVAHNRRDKLPLGLEDAELNEGAMDRTTPRKVNRRDFWLRERETLGEVLYKSRQSWDDHEESFDLDPLIGEYSWRKDTRDKISMFDEIIFSEHDYDDEAQDLEDSEPHALDDCICMNEIARKYEELSRDLENNRVKVLRKRTRRLPVDVSPETRTPWLRDRRKPPCDTVESACECREPFFRSPATCLAVGFCSCSEDNDSWRNDDNDDNDSSREVTTEGSCCYCSTYCHDRNKNNSNQSLHRKANRSTPREPLRSSRATRCDAQRRRARHEINEQDESGSGSEEAVIGREWPMDPAAVRLGRSRHDGSKTNLDRILIYPPRGEIGPPLTLYKGSSNINCRVKGDADTGFRYSVTYVQKFVSPTWMPGAEVETECCEDHG